ncbi:MAG: DUF1849 family protein [Rhodospirillales bacterium]|nr:DUF1849 family protein [Rhodospirillales bacterium]
MPLLPSIRLLILKSTAVASCLILTTAIVALLTCSGRAAVAGELLPHQASYRMSLATASQASALVGAQGVMLYRAVRDCDGWTVENTTYMRLSYQNEADVDTKWTFASWESVDGRDFRFHARLIEDGALVERLEGHAKLNGDGSGGTAVLTHPEEVAIPLPPGTLFPTHHMRALIAAAEAGEQTFARLLFDGASAANPYLVNAVIQPVPEAEQRSAALALNLPPVPMWMIDLGFFPERSREPTPEFELGARHRADGIADQITQQFDDFTLKVDLETLTVLPKPAC